MKLKWIPILLLMSGVALGFITRMFPLKEVFDTSTNVLVGRIESVDRRKRTAVAVIDRAVKGELEFKRVRMNLGLAPKTHVEYMLARLRPDQPCIIFYKREQKSLACCVHVADTWFQLFASDGPNRDKVWWRMTHLEIYMGRTYNGSTAQLIRLIDGVLSGRVKLPKPNPGIPKLDPTTKTNLAKRPKPTTKRRPGVRSKPSPAKADKSTDGLEAVPGWVVDDSWCRPGRLTIRSVKGRGKVMEVVCQGKSSKKLSLSLSRHVDTSKLTRMTLQVSSDTQAPLKVSVAFGAAPDWHMYETPVLTLKPGKSQHTLTFRLDRPQFKSESSDWKHTCELPNDGRIGKMMILVEGIPAAGGEVHIDNVRFGHGGFHRTSTFTHKGGEVRGIAWTDVNGDEMPDAYVCVGKGNLLLVNQSDGSFKEQSAALGLTGGSRAASWADYNGDGYPDLLTNNFRLYTNNRGRLRDDSKLLVAPGSRNPEGAGWIDYNGDGRPDILITNGQYGIRLYENTGKGPAWFRDVSDRVGLGRKGVGVGNGDFVTFTDIDADGYADFFYNLGNGLLIQNDGNGKFVLDAKSGISLPGTSRHKRGLTFADFDRDGDLDVFVPGPGRPRLYRNNEDGTFTDVTGEAGDLARDRSASFSAAWGDVNNDGAMDLFVCHTGSNSRLYLGDGTGKFKDTSHDVFPGGLPACFAASFADVDGDGDLDLMMNMGNKTVLALNDMDIADDRAALAVVVDAKKGATGAVVRVFDRADKPLGIYELTGADGCGGQMSPVAHFGLKRGEKVKVSVCLSDGRVGQKQIVTRTPLTRLTFAEKEFK